MGSDSCYGGHVIKYRRHAHFLVASEIHIQMYTPGMDRRDYEEILDEMLNFVDTTPEAKRV